MANYPQFPLYIPSLGRHQYMMTSKALTAMGVTHNIVVEPHEVALYKSAVKRDKLLTRVIPLDMSYKDSYEYCDDKGTTISTGSGPARNFIWEHSISEGHEYHWIMDDNIQCFRRFNKAKKVKCENPAFWSAMEDFVLRYKNVAMAGPMYSMFAPANTTAKFKPLRLNTRVFSCNLIRNDIGFRWRGRYNEDVILSADILKAGWCTILFFPFLQDKSATQTMKGGNTDTVYKHGTLEKSQMIVKVHPDISELAIRYGRYHHKTDFSGFKNQKLIKRDDYVPKNGINEYGMVNKKIK